MQEYQKIETVFTRDENTKKLTSTFRSPIVEYLKYCEWEFTEKVDGTNIRVFWDGHKVTFGGRTDKAQIPNHLLDRLEELFGGEVNEEIFEQTFGDKEVLLFGEGFGEKIQTNGYIDGVDFILFDVKVNNLWLDRESVEQIAETFNIKAVPIIMRGTIQEAIDFVKTHPNSVFPNGRDMEGVVGRPLVTILDKQGNRVIVKIKWCDFKEDKQ